MLTVPLIVNHKTDPDKVSGLVTSTFAYLGQTEDGHVQLMHINLVVWPNIPSPLHHQEADSDLEFVSVYDLGADNEDEDEEDDEEEEEEEGEEIDYANQDDVELSTTPTTTDDSLDNDAAAPNN